MKSDVICPVCQKTIGKVHGHESAKLLANHMVDEHPVEYDEIALAQEKIEEIERTYHIYARDFFYYRHEKLVENYMAKKKYIGK